MSNDSHPLTDLNGAVGIKGPHTGSSYYRLHVLQFKIVSKIAADGCELMMFCASLPGACLGYRGVLSQILGHLTARRE